MHLCVYGGQYGSEGKGSATEYLVTARREGKQLVAVGENSPNSGHTCSLGKTRNIPAASYFADSVLLGPDSAIHLPTLLEDLWAIKHATGREPTIYIHENAALVQDTDGKDEKFAGVVERISSTGSGSGYARNRKQFMRLDESVIKSVTNLDNLLSPFVVQVTNRNQYMHLLKQLHEEDVIFECSQGTLLDVNFGMFPYVTSRPTLPRVAVERNALSMLPWSYVGVYRTYPIRTGGPSGPTGGAETTFDDIGVPLEIATVTKRVRRVFEFSRDDFHLSINLTRPSLVCFTHLDYIKVKPDDLDGFSKWYMDKTNGGLGYRVEGLFLSDTTGKFVNHGAVQL